MKSVKHIGSGFKDVLLTVYVNDGLILKWFKGKGVIRLKEYFDRRIISANLKSDFVIGYRNAVLFTSAEDWYDSLAKIITNAPTSIPFYSYSRLDKVFSQSFRGNVS